MSKMVLVNLKNNFIYGCKKKWILKNKTVVVISSIDYLAVELGQVISEYGANVHISNMDLSKDINIESATDKKEDFVLIYIRK